MFKNILKSKYLIPVIVIPIFWLSLTIIRTRNQKIDIDTRVSDLENRASAIERINRGIEKILTYIKTPEFLDREARIRLNYMSADEKVAYIYKDKNTKTETGDLTIGESNNSNIFQKFWQWLVGR